MEPSDIVGFWQVNGMEKFAQIYLNKDKEKYFTDFDPSSATDFEVTTENGTIEMNGWQIKILDPSEKLSMLTWTKNGKDVQWNLLNEISLKELEGQYVMAQDKSAVVTIDDGYMHQGGKAEKIVYVNSVRDVERYFQCGEMRCRALREPHDKSIIWKTTSGDKALRLVPRYSKGDVIFCISPNKKLRRCTVQAVNGNKVDIHYIGFNKKHDETIAVSSGRISPNKPAEYDATDVVPDDVFSSEVQLGTKQKPEKKKAKGEAEADSSSKKRKKLLKRKASKATPTASKDSAPIPKTIIKKGVTFTDTPDKRSGKSPENVETPVEATPPSRSSRLLSKPQISLDDSVEHLFETADNQGGPKEEEEYLMNQFHIYKDGKKKSTSFYPFMASVFRPIHASLGDFQEKARVFWDSYFKSNFRMGSVTEDEGKVSGQKRAIVGGSPDAKRQKT